MNWEDIKLFLTIARDGSLTAAAQRLKLDPATLSRRISRLERNLQKSLFVKSPRGYALTQAGIELADKAQAMAASADEITAQSTKGGAGLSGTVRLGAPDGCANFILPAICAEILAENPLLQIQIVALPRVINLSKQEADMAISVGAPPAKRLLVEKIADYHLHLAAHRDYLGAHQPISTRNDLRHHRIIGYIPDLIFSTELDYLDTLGAQIIPQLSSNNVSVQMQFIQEQVGLGIVHDFAMARFPELTFVLPEIVALQRSYYLIRYRQERQQETHQRFAKLLVEKMSKRIAQYEADAPHQRF